MFTVAESRLLCFQWVQVGVLITLQLMIVSRRLNKMIIVFVSSFVSGLWTVALFVLEF